MNKKEFQKLLKLLPSKGNLFVENKNFTVTLREHSDGSWSLNLEPIVGDDNSNNSSSSNNSNNKNTSTN